MPPKGKANAAQKDIQETEEKFQAVVLLDSYEQKFSPFSDETPRCLLPLANVPLLEYTLNWLETAGLDEVYLYCGAHTEKIEAYIESSRWNSRSAPFTIEIIRSTSKSIGDAMRDLDTRGKLKHDFLVVYGDVVSNMPIERALAQHRARRAVDKNAIMTMVLRTAGVEHRTKASEIMPTFVIYPTKDRCLEYAQLTAGQDIELDPDTLAYGDVEVRTDLIDCGIDICTPEVLALWSDNFDYEAPRKGFLHSVLKDYELNGKTIHTFITQDFYAARVRNLAAYDAISRDVVSRFTYPFTPDSNIVTGSTFSRSKANVYREEGVKISKSALVGPNVVLGAGAKVEAGSTVRDSVIGRNAIIRKRATVTDAYLWEGVEVCEDSEIRQAIIATDTVVGKQSKVRDGVLVGPGLALPDRFELNKAATVIGKRKRESTSAEGSKEYDIIPASGHDGHEQMENTGLTGNFGRLRLSPSKESISTLGDEDDEGGSLGRTISAGSDESKHSGSGDNFVQEAANSLYDGLKNSHDSSTIQLELQGLRMSSNASPHQVRRAVVGGLMKHLAEATKAGKQAKSILASMHTIIGRTVFDASTDDKADQVDFLLIAQADAAKRPGGDSLFVAVCNGLYLIDEFDDGVFDTEAFEQWHTDERAVASEELRKVHAKMQQFMEVIADDEDEEDDDEDEGEDDSD